VLQRYPKLKGLLSDLDHVVRRTRESLKAYAVDGRCSVIAGNFFESVPSGADTYLLRHIIHDWTEEQSVKILNNCRKVIPNNGRLLIIEAVVPSGNFGDKHCRRQTNIESGVMTDGRSDSLVIGVGLRGSAVWHRRDAMLRAKGCDLQFIGGRKLPISRDLNSGSGMTLASVKMLLKSFCRPFAVKASAEKHFIERLVVEGFLDHSRQAAE
jgi:hypothetical protein